MRPRLCSAAALVLAALIACGGQVSSEGTTDGSNVSLDAGHPLPPSPFEDSGPPPPPPFIQTCTGPGDCVLEQNACDCSACDNPTISSFTAVERGQSAAFRAYTCPSDPSECAACPVSSGAFNFQAFCGGSSCQVVDVREDRISECDDPGTPDVTECVPRASTCCECPLTPDVGIVALNEFEVAAYVAQVCAPGQVCPSCTPHYTTQVKCVNLQCETVP